MNWLFFVVLEIPFSNIVVWHYDPFLPPHVLLLTMLFENWRQKEKKQSLSAVDFGALLQLRCDNREEFLLHYATKINNHCTNEIFNPVFEDDEVCDDSQNDFK